MDPITHALCGISTAIAISRNKLNKKLLLIILIVAIIPDIDIIIGRIFIKNDMRLLLHRHFTHSIIFAPIGALFLTTLFFPIVKKTQSFLSLYIMCLVSYVSHCIIDVCTAYGTMILWPFSHYRFHWDFISIIDIIPTSILLIAVILSIKKNDKKIAINGLLIFSLYFLLGFKNHISAIQELRKTITEKQVDVVLSHPQISSITKWKSVYRQNNTICSYLIQVTIYGSKQNKGGECINTLSAENIIKHLKSDIQKERIRQFNDFAGNLAGLYSGDLSGVFTVGDFRYSSNPMKNIPIWVLEFDYNNPEYVKFISYVRK